MANIGQAVLRFCGALFLAAGATLIDHPLLWNRYVSGRVATVPVVVAAKDVPEGVRLDSSALAVASWPAGSQPEGAFDRADAVYGRVSRVPIFMGEPIVPRRLAPQGTSAGLEVSITPGKRAMSIRINDFASFATRLIRPNSRVDVLVVMMDPKRPGQPVARIVATDMRVLAIGVMARRTADTAQTRATVATLEVTPHEAELLATAAVHGELRITLRGRNDSVVP